MPAYFTAKEERQYRHIQKSCRARGGSVKECKRIAAATVNKQRARKKGLGAPVWHHLREMQIASRAAAYFINEMRNGSCEDVQRFARDAEDSLLRRHTEYGAAVMGCSYTGEGCGRLNSKKFWKSQDALYRMIKTLSDRCNRAR